MWKATTLLQMHTCKCTGLLFIDIMISNMRLVSRSPITDPIICEFQSFKEEQQPSHNNLKAVCLKDRAVKNVLKLQLHSSGGGEYALQPIAAAIQLQKRETVTWKHNWRHLYPDQFTSLGGTRACDSF